MKIMRNLFSAVISLAVISSSASIPMQAVLAAETAGAETSDIYDITKSSESKDSQTIMVSDADVKTAVTTSEAPFNVFDIYDAHQTYVKRHDPSMLYRSTEGIDVSQWQGSIDWDTVAASGVDYAIIRAGYGKELFQKDPTFDTNMKGAQAAGLDCGTYWYSYALTVEDAYREAETCYEIIKDYDFTYPVYFDIEDPSQKYLTTAQVSAIIDAFCSTLQEKGYYVGVYSYANFLTTRVYEDILDKYDVWVAHFDVPSPDYRKEYGMWQYSSTGYVDGISGRVDLDHAYVNYPYIISPETYVPDGSETGKTDPDIPDALNKGIANGIDVSVWQGKIDWERVGESGIDYAIIRAGYGDLASQRDKYFEVNMAGAEMMGIDRGVYWYSYATTPEDALLEAQACYEVIQGYSLEYPVYFDVEDPVLAELSSSEISAIIDAFCSYFEEKGYYVGITSYSNFLNTKVEPYIFKKYDVWVSHYGVVRPAFRSSYNMWQFTNSGEISGINGYVDCDYAYLDFPAIMEKYHKNGY